MMVNYRTRIYDEYATGFRGETPRFDPAAADRWGRAYAHYLRGFLPRRRDAALVDLACGGGQLLHFLKGLGYTNLAGVDISPEQVELAKQVIPDVVRGDVREFLGGHVESFDLITAFDIVEHLQKNEVLGFLEGCFTALKPGGRLVLQTPNADSPFAQGVRYGDFTHETCFSPECLSRLLQLCGFGRTEVRELGPIPWGYSVSSTLRFLAWRFLRLGLVLFNRIETGNRGSGVMTRVFIATGGRSSPS